MIMTATAIILALATAAAVYKTMRDAKLAQVKVRANRRR